MGDSRATSQQKKEATSAKHNSFIVGTSRYEVLVGGPYSSNGEDHPYGHAALRTVTEKSDTIYDFGRYGRVWGTASSEGDGVLRVWSSFIAYIHGENATGRTTVAFAFNAKAEDINAINRYFETMIAGLSPTQVRAKMTQYTLKISYHALNCNCTTMTVDGVRVIRPDFANKNGFNNGKGLGRMEKAAVHFGGWPNRIFMPADLSDYIKSLSGDGEPVKTTTYSKSQTK